MAHRRNTAGYQWNIDGPSNCPHRYAARPHVSACAVAAALLMGLLAGCSDPGTGPTEKAEATVATLLHTCAREDGRAVEELLTPPTRAEIIEAESVVAGCDSVLELGAGDDAAAPTVFAEAQIVEVRVDDQFGTATIRAPGGNTTDVELENTGDQWLVANPTIEPL